MFYFNDVEYYGYVYCTFDQKENKVYIGQKSGDPKLSTNYFGSGTIIKKIIKSRGTYFLKKNILGFCKTREELLYCETECKYFFNAFDRKYGYNIAVSDKGGDLISFHPDISEIKEKFKTRSKKLWQDDSYRNKLIPQISKRFDNDKMSGKIKELWKDPDWSKNYIDNNLLGEKNPMYNRSIYSVWKEKFGKEIADEKYAEWKSNISKSSRKTYEMGNTQKAALSIAKEKPITFINWYYIVTMYLNDYSIYDIKLKTGLTKRTIIKRLKNLDLLQ